VCVCGCQPDLRAVDLQLHFADVSQQLSDQQAFHTRLLKLLHDTQTSVKGQV